MEHEWRWSCEFFTPNPDHGVHGAMDTSIKITVRMTKQQINKEQTRVYLIGLDKKQQSNGVCFMSHVCNLVEAPFLFLGLILTSEELNGGTSGAVRMPQPLPV